MDNGTDKVNVKDGVEVNEMEDDSNAQKTHAPQPGHDRCKRVTMIDRTCVQENECYSLTIRRWMDTARLDFSIIELWGKVPRSTSTRARRHSRLFGARRVDNRGSPQGENYCAMDDYVLYFLFLRVRNNINDFFDSNGTCLLVAALAGVIEVLYSCTSVQGKLSRLDDSLTRKQLFGPLPSTYQSTSETIRYDPESSSTRLTRQ